LELKQKAKDTADATMQLDMFRNYLAEDDIVLNNNGQLVKTESKTASWIVELETSTCPLDSDEIEQAVGGTG
jgi:hypothetical protein